MHVCQHHWHLSTHNDQQHQHHKQKPKHIIYSPHPDTWHDEKQLNEQGSKG